MNVLVVNAGSSSLKYQLIDVENHKIMAKGICERVGSPESFHKHGLDENEIAIDVPIPDHNAAVTLMLEALTSGPNKAVDSLDEIDAIGHRIVQGGKYFDRSVLVDEEVIAKIDELIELAPLHNGPAIMGIRACQAQMPNTPMAVAFDTSYFQTLPPEAYMYPVPYELYERYAIRKYGAHGTSHRYVAQQAAAFLGKPLNELKLITCHLGNGCSITAVDQGVAVDTSMGLTPLDGLMMGTRCGAIDPAIVTFVMEHDGLEPHEMSELMNKKSGLLGISGISNDMRSVQQAMDEGDERAKLAFDMYVYSVKKYLGQYVAIMGGVDAVVLTAGIGENSPEVRAGIFKGFEHLGVEIDPERNKERGFERDIATDNSRIRVIVIPTDEEYMIARDTFDLVRGMN